MKIRKIILSIVVLSLLYTAFYFYGNIINFDKIAEKHGSFQLVYNNLKQNTINDTSTFKIVSLHVDKNSEKILKLRSWFHRNAYFWQKTIPIPWASPNFMLTDNDFRLLVFDTFIVLNFEDESGKNQEYKREIDKNELDFLRY